MKERIERERKEKGERRMKGIDFFLKENRKRIEKEKRRDRGGKKKIEREKKERERE